MEINSEKISDLIARIKTDDLSAFGELYDVFSKQIYGKCLFVLKDSDLAHDATHDTFLKVLAKINQLQDSTKFIGWMNRLCYNVCMDIFRELTKESEQNQIFVSEIEEMIHDLDSIYKSDKLKIHLRQLISELKEIDRLVITMYYWDEMSVREIANELALSESAIKMKLKRTRESLHHKLDYIISTNEISTLLWFAIFSKSFCDQNSY